MVCDIAFLKMISQRLLINVLFFPLEFLSFPLVNELLTCYMRLMIFIVLTPGDSKP